MKATQSIPLDALNEGSVYSVSYMSANRPLSLKATFAGMVCAGRRLPLRLRFDASGVRWSIWADQIVRIEKATEWESL